MRLLPLASASMLVACSGAAPPASPAGPASGCPGTIEVVDGLREIEDGALLRQALGAPGDGYLCTGKVFEVTKPVTVYRVWNKSKPATRLGRWWSFSTPRGPVEAYRTAYCMCAEWSPLDVMSECKIKVGARVVVGPGQSATCAKTSYPASATNQVFIPNDTRDPAHPRLFVEGCSAGAAWP
jgi:hypothetical protein